MFCHDFRLRHRKSRQNEPYVFLPRVNTRGYKYSAPPELFNHAAVCLCAVTDVSYNYDLL